MAQKSLDIAEGQTDMFSSCDIGIDDMKPGLAYPSEEVAVEAILRWGEQSRKNAPFFLTTNFRLFQPSYF